MLLQYSLLQVLLPLLDFLDLLLLLLVVLLDLHLVLGNVRFLFLLIINESNGRLFGVEAQSFQLGASRETGCRRTAVMSEQAGWRLTLHHFVCSLTAGWSSGLRRGHSGSS